MNSIVYKNFLYEAIPDVTSMNETWLKYLKEKYTDLEVNKNLYVTFVTIDKVGINPNSKWLTPSGVYCYPMNYVLINGRVPFKNEDNLSAYKIKVIKAVNDKVLSDLTSEQEYNNAIYKLKLMHKQGLFRIDTTFDNFIKYSENNASEGNVLGKLWNVTRLLSSNYYRASNMIKNKKSSENRVNNIYYWSKLLIELGFDYVLDNGYGVIHSNEPTQAVFLNPKAYQVVDESFVSTQHKYMDNVDNFTKDFLKHLAKHGWNDDKVYIALEEVKKCGLLKVKDYFGHTALAYLMSDEFSTSSQIIKLIDKCFLKNGSLIDIDYYVKFLTTLAMHNPNAFKNITTKYNIFNEYKLAYSKILTNLLDSNTFMVASYSTQVIKSIDYILDILDFENMFHSVHYKQFNEYMEKYYKGDNKELILTEFAKYLAEGEAKMEDLERLLKDT